jgi:hypothetical protein
VRSSCILLPVFHTDIYLMDNVLVKHVLAASECVDHIGEYWILTMKNAVYWDVVPCTSCVSWRSIFGGRKTRERGTSVSKWLQISLPWKWRRYIPPKHRFTQDLHSAASQKMAFFIVTAVKTSNLIWILRVSNYLNTALLMCSTLIKLECDVTF